jgi:hypothetical protein
LGISSPVGFLPFLELGAVRTDAPGPSTSTVRLCCPGVNVCVERGVMEHPIFLFYILLLCFNEFYVSLYRRNVSAYARSMRAEGGGDRAG